MKNKPLVPQQKAIDAAIDEIKNSPSFSQAKYIIKELADIYVNEYFFDSIITKDGPNIIRLKEITDDNIEKLTEDFISFCYSESDRGFLLTRPGSFNYTILKMVVFEYFWHRYFETDISIEHNIQQLKRKHNEKRN